MTTATPHSFRVFHVFLSSPNDMEEERQEVRDFFDRWNRASGRALKTRLEVVDWTHYSTGGLGRPQDLITRQTLGSLADSLILFIGLLGDRFGSPTGKSDSGTEEEFNWVMRQRKRGKRPEIKLFFRRQTTIELQADPGVLIAAADQLRKVLAFKEKCRSSRQVFYKEFDAGEFGKVLLDDLELWLNDPARPWRQSKETPPAIVEKPYGPMPPDKSFKERITDLRMLWVPGGRLTIGQGRYKNAAPVRVSPFWIGETPISNRHYGIFLAHSGHPKPEFWNELGFTDRQQPVVGVTWHDAMSFCEWLSKASGLRCSLCSEAQWEFAARGEDGRTYPWGNDPPTPKRAVYGLDRATGRPTPVGVYLKGRGPFGARDQAGLVWEWCLDAFYEDAYDAWARRMPLDPVTEVREDDLVPDEPDRVLRGACWGDPAEYLVSAVRYGQPASHRSSRVGFRIAVLP